jgi:hypothetical protein
MGIGQYYRGITEHCLFGVRGNIPYQYLPDGKRAQGLTGFTAPRKQHSEKPEELRQMIMKVSPGPYLELFARKETPGWSVWGNEVNSTIDMPEVKKTFKCIFCDEDTDQDVCKKCYGDVFEFPKLPIVESTMCLRCGECEVADINECCDQCEKDLNSFVQAKYEDMK